MRQIIDSTALDRWFVSTRRDAQELLPHVVRRLLLETVPQHTLSYIYMPVGDQISMPSYDGVLITSDEHPFVPLGISAWEMSAGPPEKKLIENYQKRTDKPQNVIPSQTTFVFVSPHPYSAKLTREVALKDEGTWKGVRILDGNDLATWLEIGPVTARWLAREMGIPVDGMLGLDEYLRQELKARYGREIPPDLLIGGRSEPHDKLVEWLNSDFREIRIEGESQEESCAFIAAVVSRLSDDKRRQIDSCLSFVSDPKMLDVLSQLQTPHFIITMWPEVRRRAVALVPPSMRIIVPRMRMAGASDTSHERGTIKLGAIHRTNCDAALRGMGFTTVQSDRISRESKGSLTAVLWMIAQEHDTPLSWANAEAAHELLPILLAGQWDMENQRDRAIIEHLTSKTYTEIENVLARWRSPNGPLVLRGMVWDWLAWDYAWACLCPFMTPSLITLFGSAVETVLREPDPKLALPAEKRWAAAVHGKKHPFSEFLRTGLVGSVVHFSTNAKVIEAGDGDVIAGNMVRKLLGGESFDRTKTWLSLVAWLPDFAEAAPDEFLQALDHLLSDKPCVDAFFEEGGVFGSSPHGHLLWALERLAWEPTLLTRVTISLGDLAALDPGGHISNRPINSLTQIYLPWCPQTVADPLQRIAAIDTLRKQHPETAWKLAASLLPEATSISTLSAEPHWRTWKPDGEVRVLSTEYWQFIEEMVNRMLQWAGLVGANWRTLIDSYNNLRMGHPNLAAQVLTALQGLEPAAFIETDTSLISDALRSMLSRHREIPDADLAMSEELLLPFEELYSRFQPKGLVSRFKWLFTSWPNLPHMRDVSYEEQSKLIQEERLKAADEIMKSSGIEAALSMFDHLERPDTLGGSLAESGLDQDSEQRLLRVALHLQPLPDRFPATLRAVFGYVGRKYAKEGDMWLQRIVSSVEMQWDANALANLALGLPDEGPTWDKLAEWDVEADRIYWQRTLISHLRDKQRDAERAVSSLLKAGRAYRAIEVAGMAVGRPGRRTEEAPLLVVSPNLIITALQVAPQKKPSDEWFAPQMTMLVHHVETLLHALENVGVELGVLAGIEWAWLAGLEHSRRGVQALEKALANDPSLFVDILKLVFRAEGEEQRELLESESNRATQAYRLLAAWHRVPGMRELEDVEKEFEGDIVFSRGTVDETRLREWTQRARELAAACGRMAICDSRIGQVLAYSPIGEDDAWPCVPVRNLIEHLRSVELEHGIETGVYNKRRAHFRMKGGVQEQRLSEKFSSYADKIRTGWVRTGAVLDRIVDHLHKESKWHQKQEEFEEFE